MENLRTGEDKRTKPKYRSVRRDAACCVSLMWVTGYAVAPNRTETSFDTPGSCMVTPYSTGAIPMVFLL